ncbi:MAG: glycosyltransferase family 1 protein, partial [Patescibacteria group bacterium]|nr:glycosyltransferase family 1 protein [Patescibacteria group bacterium]
KDVPDLIEKARYYLTHESERARIARAGYERTLREHTYEKRFQELFRAMKLPGYSS